MTTVLTITTLMSTANVNLPPTAYPKSIGVFLAGCFVFTFLAFLEYSAASYLERRRNMGKFTGISNVFGNVANRFCKKNGKRGGDDDEEEGEGEVSGG